MNFWFYVYEKLLNKLFRFLHCFSRNSRKMRTSSKRFDFGVPLEDVFPLNDIHPRLRFLFSEAYQVYIQSDLTVEEVLKEYQDSLEVKLEFKERLIYDKQYGCLSNYLPGTYFWLIRHFLGLLPIPLMPNYSNGFTFNWKEWSDTCKDYFRQYHHQKNLDLDYQLAQNLNMVPFEHFVLLNVLVTFIRKVSQRYIDDLRLNRKKLVTLIKFYCGAVFNRPCRPGCEIEDKQMSPLFTYLILRWSDIRNFCDQIGYPTYFLESPTSDTCDKKNTRDNWVQTSLFNPDIITMYKNVSTNIYLKENGSQTESDFTNEKGIQIKITSEDVNEKFKPASSNPFVNGSLLLEDSYVLDTHDDKNSQVNNNVDCEISDRKTSEVNLSETNEKSEEKYSESLTENSELNFFSILESSRDDNWADVLNDTLNTVKKVEGYIYDDYETFNKEDFNQITCTSIPAKPALLRQISKIGLIRASSKNSPRESANEKCDGNLQQSYLKFNDGIEDDFNGLGANKNTTAEKENIDNSFNVTFHSCNSDDNLCSARMENPSKNEEKNKTNFNLKRFKIKMDFLRILSPKRSTPLKPTYDYCTSSVNYKKIKNCKASTI